MAASPNNFSPEPPRAVSPWDGILLVDKPSGPTSHDIVDAVRRQFRFRKVGHGGTLDPQATGLLVILLGKGTKLSNRFAGADKVYEGSLRLGVATDSQDAQGKILREADCSQVTREQVEEQMRTFLGDTYQVPPMVSAMKVEGVPLYKLARRGKTVDREPKLIHVYEFRLVEFRLPSASFVLRCSKGTYVRTLCADIGDRLGCGAHLERLRRTVCGDFDVKDAVSLEALMAMDSAALADRIIPLHLLGGGYGPVNG